MHTPHFYRIFVAVAFYTIFMVGVNDGALGVLLPNISAHYQANNATISLLFLFSTFGYLLASFNNGLLVARFGKERALLFGCLIFCASFLALCLAPPWFYVLLPLYLMLGFGIALLDAGLNTLMAMLPRSTVLLNYFHFFYGVGAWLGPNIATGVLALRFGWNSAYALWLILGLIALFGMGWTFRKQRIAGGNQEQSERGSGRGLLKATLSMKSVWLAAGFLLFYVGTEVTLGSWGYSFLTKERHGDPVLMGPVVSGYWLGLAIGRLILGKLTEYTGPKNMVIYCLAGTILGLLILWLVPVQTIAIFGFFLTGFSLAPMFPIVIAIMPKFAPHQLLPSAVGFLTSLGSMGAALFPWLVGTISQYFGLWILMPFTVVTSLLMFLFWLLLHAAPVAQEEQA
ncbi:MFS transporter [Thermosporothrix hazakensis]|uniref:MFS transporter n=1 Tax=Thermosporothrix hazakensis TaxID=644383 RepID=UPI001B876A74|nr:MFS transporter [Thermosporothrix hazakensis]